MNKKSGTNCIYPRSETRRVANLDYALLVMWYKNLFQFIELHLDQSIKLLIKGML